MSVFDKPLEGCIGSGVAIAGDQAVICLRVKGGLQVECGDDKWRRLLLSGALGSDVLVALHPHLQLAPAHLSQPRLVRNTTG